MNRGLRGLIEYLWKYRGLVGLGLLGVIVSDVCQLIVPLVIQRGVDQLAGQQATRESLKTLGLALFTLAALGFLSKFAWRHFLFTASRKAELDLRNRLLAKVLRLPASEKSRIGDFLALASNDVSSIQQALAFALLAAFDSVAFSLAALGAMLWLDWRMALWTILPFPLLAFVMVFTMRQIYYRWDVVQSTFSELTEKVRESIAGIRILRSFVQREGDCRDFERLNETYRDRTMDYVKVDAVNRPSIMFLAGGANAILLFVGGTRVLLGETTVGTFTAFTVYLALLTWPMIAAGWMLVLVQRGAASMARFLELLDLPEEAEPPPVELSPTGTLEIRGLTFRYPGEERPALEDLSFKLEPGQTLGIVGEVGSGKSTLVKLLIRLHEPPPGTVFLDGVDLRDLPLRQVREAISLVPQEAFLFSDTIEANLRLADPAASREALEEVTRTAALHKEILEFPNGYETMLGERGISLSGGQKQRLCLARALLKPAPVLVFDDTLSAVDHDTEHRILESLRQRQIQQTKLIVSHRISAVQEADAVLVLHQGRQTQFGTHAELVAQEGFYSELHRLQKLEEESLRGV